MSLNWQTRCAASVLGLMTLAITAAPPSATASQAVEPTFSPHAGVIFNSPAGTAAEQYAIKTEINRSIDATPAGGTIRIATYSFGFDDTVNKLVAAKARGVHVRVLIDSHTTTNQTARLTAQLGSNLRSGSFVRRCRQSCMSNRPSVMHAKMYLFSAAGSSRLVSMVASANLTSSSEVSSWNNLNTVLGNQTVYSSLTRYFDDMVRDADNLHYFRTTTSGMHQLSFYPRAAVRGRNTVTVLDALNRVTCTGSAPGFGSRGRTVIRVSMFQWGGSRVDLARKLTQLRDRGCVVEVVTNVPIAGPGIMATLLKKGRYGATPVYDALFDYNRDGVADRYVHHKVVTINGSWNGSRRAKVVFTGSQNFTENSTRNDNEIVYRITDAATYNAYDANLSTIRDHYARRVLRTAVHSLSVAAMDKLMDDDVVVGGR